MQSTTIIDGIDVIIEGEGERTIVMVHGWPDTYRVWDAQVASFQAHYRCVRFTLPGFDASKPRHAYGLDEMMGIFANIVKAVSPIDKVTMLMHDWGAAFGYQFCMRYPHLVERMVGVDIGDTGSPQYVKSLSVKAKLGVAAYQLTLALAWKLGGRLGTRMTRGMAKLLRAPSQAEFITSDMNFPYFIFMLFC
jgi:pimeloyl-ACP methyl ester carboxylesterase